MVGLQPEVIERGHQISPSLSAVVTSVHLCLSGRLAGGVVTTCFLLAWKKASGGVATQCV